MAQGAQPIVGYNYGSGQLDRVRKTFRLLITAGIIYSVAGCLLVELASAPGGIPACTRTDVTRIDAPGLPGRFCPASAGAAYAAAILEQEGAFPA